MNRRPFTRETDAAKRERKLRLYQRELHRRELSESNCSIFRMCIGIQSAQQVHSSAGSTPGDVRRFLENGLGSEVSEYRYGNKHQRVRHARGNNIIDIPILSPVAMSYNRMRERSVRSTGQTIWTAR